MPKVLVVDDDTGLRGLMRVTLGDDYEVLEASDGTEAVALAGRELPDLVLLDVRMPGLNGIGACARIKGMASTAQTKIVMVSGMGSEDVQQQARAAGADAFLPKPYSPLALLRQIDALLNPSPGSSPPSACQRPGPPARTYRLFFAHAGAPEQSHRSLQELLREVPGFAWQDVTSYALDPDADFPTQARIFDSQVRPAGCMLVLTELYRVQRPLLHAQVHLALAYHKPIIAVLPPDARPISPTLAKLAHAQVPWRANAVVGAIHALVI